MKKTTAPKKSLSRKVKTALPYVSGALMAGGLVALYYQNRQQIPSLYRYQMTDGSFLFPFKEGDLHMDATLSFNAAQ